MSSTTEVRDAIRDLSEGIDRGHDELMRNLGEVRQTIRGMTASMEDKTSQQHESIMGTLQAIDAKLDALNAGQTDMLEAVQNLRQRDA
ncbi:hypothetical protein [Nocardia sp. NPDC020380]|uniref:hypothetical protein n=1 Tax=Nocardia sp. NPDC020380 TaxID=3364309 RepID=UPI00378A9C39